MSVSERSPATARVWAARALLGTLAASCGDGPAVAANEQALVGGSIDMGDDAVVALVAGSEVICSGVYVGERVVLTAAHCLEADRVFFGSGPHLGGYYVEVERSEPHPRYIAGRHEHDLGGLLLAEDAPDGVHALPLLRDALDTSFVGSRIRLVGFGGPSAASTVIALKEEATTAVTALDRDSFYHEPDPGLACFGDSGGPALSEVDGVEYVAGIATAGDRDCEEYGVHLRIDQNLEEFIASFPDPSTELGDACHTDGNCISNACIAATELGAFRYCSAACSDDSDCPSDMPCTVDNGGDRFCRFQGPSPGTLGSECSHADDCASGLCVSEDAEGQPYCALRCFSSNALACPLDYECRSIAESELEACFRMPSGGVTAAGCSVAGDGRNSSAALWLLVGCLAIAWRRRVSRVLSGVAWRASRFGKLSRSRSRPGGQAYPRA